MEITDFLKIVSVCTSSIISVCIVVTLIVKPIRSKLILLVKKTLNIAEVKLFNIIMEPMGKAETKFNDGATRKEYVMASVKASTNTINYDVNMGGISALIDGLCEMTKVINSPAKKVGE